MLFKIAGVDCNNPNKKREIVLDAEDEMAARARAFEMGIDPARGSVTALPPTESSGSRPSGGGFENALLLFGQIVSVVGCAVAPVSVWSAIHHGHAPCFAIFAGVCAFLYSAALFVVFTRVKRLPPG